MNQDLKQFDALKAQVTMFVQPTHQIVVKDAMTNVDAQQAVRTLKDYEKKIDATLKELIQPHKDFIERVRAYAVEIRAPLEQAEKEIKAKQVAWAEEQQKLRDAELKRLAEIREAEAKKAVELRAQQEEADRQAHIEEEKRIKAEQERERKAAEAKYKKDQEALKAFGMDDETIKLKAEEEKRIRREKFERDQEEHNQKIEQERLEARAKFEREQRDRDLELKKQEAALIASKPKNTREIPEWRIVDPSLIPEKYKKIDEVAIGKDVRGGLMEIPGCEIRMKIISAGN
jgi:hypothetical protein